MMLKVFVGTAIALLTAAPVSAQDTIPWQNDVQGWNVAVDRTIDNSCFIISGFGSDLFLRVQFNTTKQNLQFIVANIKWKSFEAGEPYDMEVAFGDLEPWSGVAHGFHWNEVLPSLVLSVPIEDQKASHFIEQFSATSSVTVSHGGSEIASLSLAGTDQAIASMLDCQTSMMKSIDRKKSGASPFASETDPI
ncbi:hypothetical protein N9C96_00535 [bacterium]|nr:hypothetical protein [bacterium]